MVFVAAIFRTDGAHHPTIIDKEREPLLLLDHDSCLLESLTIRARCCFLINGVRMPHSRDRSYNHMALFDVYLSALF